MHTNPTTPVQPPWLLSCFFLVHWVLILSVTGALSAVAEKHYQQVARIDNGGDAPPLVELEYLKADDPAQIASGDAVAYVSGTQEKLLRCSSVRIELLAKLPAADAQTPYTENLDTEQEIGRQPAERNNRRLKREQKAQEERADLHCTMWVRKLGTDVYRPHDLGTAIDLLQNHDQNGVILTLALRNLGNADFHGSFKMINVLPDDLEFIATVAVAEWTGLARQELLPDLIAFQEHLHGQALIYQAKAVSIAPRETVAVDYIARVASW
jgi:hypothetical protein